MRVASRKKFEAKQKLVALVSQGHTIKASLKLISRSPTWYEENRKADSLFARKVDAARLGRDDPTLTGIDFISFRLTFFDRNTPVHHLQMVQAIEKAKVGTLTMILAPPAHGKTSLLVDYICWKLAVDPNFRVAIVSEAEDLAKKILSQIARRMTDDSLDTNRRFIETYGPFKAPDRELQKPWNTERISLLRATHDEKEPSIEVKGAGGQIYGARYDLIIFDDIQSTKNLNQTAKLLQYFRQDVYTRQTDVTRFIVVGTRVGPGDFYETLLGEEELVDDLVKLAAVTTSDGGLTRTALWPEQWSLERLDQLRRKVGEETWARVYQQEPVSSLSATFTEAALESVKNPLRTIEDWVIGRRPEGAVGTICVLDPAPTQDSGFLAIAFNSERFWLLDADSVKNLSRTEEQLDFMEHYSARYRPMRWIVEKNIGRAIARDDRLVAMADTYGFEIGEHYTSGGTKYDEDTGVRSMASLFVRGEIDIPWGDEDSRRKFGVLVDELNRWRANIPSRLLKQDLVICLWMAWHWWQRDREATEKAAEPRLPNIPSWLMAEERRGVA